MEKTPPVSVSAAVEAAEAGKRGFSNPCSVHCCSHIPLYKILDHVNAVFYSCSVNLNQPIANRIKISSSSK